MQARDSLAMNGLIAASAAATIAILVGVSTALVPGPSQQDHRFVTAKPIPTLRVASAAISAHQSSIHSVCPYQVRSGQALQQDWGRRGIPHAHILMVENHAGKNAIIKLRNAAFGRTAVSMFIAINSTAVYDRVPDGAYYIEYAFGDGLDAACMTFTKLTHAGQFRHPYLFNTAYDEHGPHPTPLSLRISVPANDDTDVSTIDGEFFKFD
jgi:hypothetical protein